MKKPFRSMSYERFSKAMDKPRRVELVSGIVKPVIPVDGEVWQALPDKISREEIKRLVDKYYK